MVYRALGDNCLVAFFDREDQGHAPEEEFRYTRRQAADG